MNKKQRRGLVYDAKHLSDSRQSGEFFFHRKGKVKLLPRYSLVREI